MPFMNIKSSNYFLYDGLVTLLANFCKKQERGESIRKLPAQSSHQVTYALAALGQVGYSLF
jgi:hypothetical protein